ncbi:hypothetical protein DFJ67_1148 [Asanoa ferruginea]|uniref:Uncharacterized protein n=2 Tax=Asanoa ferruginea TaxID=53367 RepID=A0A3D9ZCQ4_9ACTN|nr:hypothetical protein DFJ67_1148 [Asanoa ferruginea]GIF52818.1 hypothetical protein Afe04nite_73570 [Asanoa ferruginea]
MAAFCTAAIILLAACDSGQGAPIPTAQPPPQAAESASPAAGCAPQGGTCRGDLAAGTYTTTTFRPAITYTVPDGWINGLDLPGNFLLSRTVDPDENFYGSNGINLMADVAPAAQDCAEAAEPAVGRTAQEITRWLAGLPGLKSTTPRSTSIGGWSGFTVDLTLADTWKRSCPFADEPVLPLTISGDPAQFHLTRTIAVKGLSQRAYVLDRPDGKNLLILVLDIPGGVAFDDYLKIAAPVVESLRFAP